jgi:hypothetical protein
MTATANAFRLSRIYAEGWVAARSAYPAGRIKRPIGNPYPAGPEHNRWQAGFKGALAERKSVK